MSAAGVTDRRGGLRRRWPAAIAVLLLAVAVVAARPVRGAYLWRRSREGTRPVALTYPATDLRGRSYRVTAPDSETLVFFLNAGCTICRRQAPTFGNEMRWAAIQGIAVRMLLPNGPDSVAAFARLVGDAPVMLMLPRDWFRQLGIRVAPTVLLVDRSGTVIARWIGSVPTRAEIAEALDLVPSGWTVEHS